jgi:hypothetical protein
MQVELKFYNTTELRFMYRFPSRGTLAQAGNNWTATSTATGDFLAKNLNTDIVEQVWRSNGSPSSQTLTCDTGIVQGITTDTIAILNHNLSNSASVQVQGSNDNFATSPIFSFNLNVETKNIFYISETYPNSSMKCRYWRFIIQDVANASGYIEVGTILFGQSMVFSYPENFTSPISFGYKHFKDSIQTEGFTNVSNDRAIKKFINLNFQKLDLNKGNYENLKEMIEYSRTSLKCLIIPTPKIPSRFAVFAKLTDMPTETHDYVDISTQYVSLDLSFDESL